jgi:hypothetical protein
LASLDLASEILAPIYVHISNRITSTAYFLPRNGTTAVTKDILRALPTFYLYTLKLVNAIIEVVDK